MKQVDFAKAEATEEELLDVLVEYEKGGWSLAGVAYFERDGHDLMGETIIKVRKSFYKIVFRRVWEDDAKQENYGE